MVWQKQWPQYSYVWPHIDGGVMLWHGLAVQVLATVWSRLAASRAAMKRKGKFC